MGKKKHLWSPFIQREIAVFQAGKSQLMFFEGICIGKPYWRLLDIGIFSVLICFLKSQTNFLHFRDIQRFVLCFFKLPESCEGLGHSILLARVGHRGLWPCVPQWHQLSFFVIFFAFFPHFYGNFWQCPLYYAVQHNLEKKNKKTTC